MPTYITNFTFMLLVGCILWILTFDMFTLLVKIPIEQIILLMPGTPVIPTSVTGVQLVSSNCTTSEPLFSWGCLHLCFVFVML